MILMLCSLYLGQIGLRINNEVKLGDSRPIGFWIHTSLSAPSHLAPKNFRIYTIFMTWSWRVGWRYTCPGLKEANFPLFVYVQQLKSFRGLAWPLTRSSVPECWLGLLPQTPVIDSRSVLVMPQLHLTQTDSTGLPALLSVDFKHCFKCHREDAVIAVEPT